MTRNLVQGTGRVYSGAGSLQNSPWSSAAGGMVKLFESTLAVDSASLDTGAAAIASGHGDLIVFFTGRTADAGETGSVGLTFNGDTGANYDFQWMSGNGTSVTAGFGHAINSAATSLHGSSGSAYPGFWNIAIPAYDGSTFWKIGTLYNALEDSAASFVQPAVFGWRSTAAISQMTFTGATANLKAGSRLIVYGTQ